MVSSKKLKILMVMDSFSPGGAQRVVLDLLRAAVADGYKVYLAVSVARGELLQDLPDGVPVFEYGKYRGLHNIFNLKFFFERVCFLNEIDVIFSNMTQLNKAVLRAKFFYRLSPPVFVIEHTNINRYIKSNNSFWKNLIRPLELSLLYKTARGVVAVSDELADEVASTLKLDRDSIATIHNPISIEANHEADRKPNHFRGPDRTFISVGRLEDVKNFSLLIKAFREVKSLREGYTDRLIIVGDGGQSGTLKRLVSEHHLDETVEFTGFTKNVREQLLKADFFVSSSRYEGFPLAMLEAVANGLPCVATPTTGSRELSRYLGCIKRSNNHTVSSLSSAMIEAIHDTELYVSKDDMNFVESLTPEIVFTRYMKFVKEKI
ncbi:MULTISPECIES: glycosyltransferase [unclassified Roseobacter]|uniref:glycosyltransferase n=1 Tax=unclassified Roseobacter TaxID=196798 RepID=UPI0030EBBBF5